MELPKDKEIITGEIADYWVDGGILYSLSKPPQRNIDNITRNVALVKKITANKKVPLLIYLCKSPIPDKATRNFVNTQLPTIYSAMAMVSDGGLAKFIMNFLFKLKSPPIPMKSFTNAVEAKEWLRQYL